MPNDTKSKLVEFTRAGDGKLCTLNSYWLAELSDGYLTINGKRGPQQKACTWCSLMSGTTVHKIPVEGRVEELAPQFPALVVLTKASGEGMAAIHPRVLVEIGSGLYTDPRDCELEVTWVVWTFGDYTRKTAVLEPYEAVVAAFGLRAAS